MECSYCGQEVFPTVHRRDGNPPYRVGYYRLLTGKLIPVTMQNPRNVSETIEFFKLVEPRWVIACVNCFERTEVREELEKLFSGVPEVKKSPEAE